MHTISICCNTCFSGKFCVLPHRLVKRCSFMIILTRCSMRETRETALLHIACGKPARRRYCMHGCKVQICPHNQRQLHQFACILYAMNSKNSRKKSPIHENADADISCDFGDGDISRFTNRLPHTWPDGHTVRWPHR